MLLSEWFEMIWWNEWPHNTQYTRQSRDTVRTNVFETIHDHFESFIIDYKVNGKTTLS